MSYRDSIDICHPLVPLKKSWLPIVVKLPVASFARVVPWESKRSPSIAVPMAWIHFMPAWQMKPTKLEQDPVQRNPICRGHDILEIAQQSGAQAIHPGYGFLSENAKFCQQADDKTLPLWDQVRVPFKPWVSKAESKAIMEDANVPTTPGYHGSNQDPEYLLHEAVTNVGFPLLIKAVSGGGGKGMRQVWREQDFLAALESCKRESQSAFGDDSVILEKYLVNPRHVEVQVVADDAWKCLAFI